MNCPIAYSHPVKRRAWTVVLVGWLLVMGSCSLGRTGDIETRGGDPVEYFESWANALSTGDAYGVLDFYTVDATVENRTGVFGDLTPPVHNTLRGNTAQIPRELLEVHVGFQQGVVVVIWPDRGEYRASLMDMVDGLISRETVFLDATSLGRSLRASPEVVALYVRLYEAYAAAWSDSDSQQASRLYAAEAVIRDALVGAVPVGGGLDGEISNQDETWMAVSLNALGVGEDDPSAGIAVFIDPVDFGADSERAIGIFDVRKSDDCLSRVAVHWRLAGGLIVAEDRFRSSGPTQECESEELPDGWWTNLELPGHRDQLETGVVVTPAGNTVSVRNGSQTLERLVRWGFDRFSKAGLPEPEIDSVTFEPTRTCEGVSGRLVDNPGSRNLALCFFEEDVCPDPDRCAVMTLSTRVALLHELSHAWMLDQLDSETRDEVLALSARSEWDSLEVPWGERGVEYSAQILAWGVGGEDLPLVELGGPSCREAEAAFELLTGSLPSAQVAPCSLSS